jgi:preprotein translocase subunit YajC|tara:strand:- start:194 stop:472 length:279 start_codon:yes stop_codon:yes gene_type:complete
MEQMLVQLMPLFLIFAIFYFLLIRPQQRRAKEHKEMVAGVQRGDKIVSSGGIRGKVVKVVGDFDVEVEISQGVNVTLVKSTIAEVVKESTPK